MYIANNLPAVSWIVGPTNTSEHATNHPSAGEWFTSQILAQLQANPAVYARTIFIFNYDEGGQVINSCYTAITLTINK